MFLAYMGIQREKLGFHQNSKKSSCMQLSCLNKSESELLFIRLGNLFNLLVIFFSESFCMGHQSSNFGIAEL